MKTNSKFLLTILAAASIALASCSGKKEGSEAHDHNAHSHDSTGTSAATSEAQYVVDAKFQQQLSDYFKAYVELKDAFVATDIAKVKTEVAETNDVLAKVDMALLTDVAHHDWMTFLTPMQTSLKEISSATDIAAQRKSFSTLSDNLYKSIKAFGLGGTEAFYEYCPMAFSNEGAYWLSDQEKIRNPYFGDEMLTCGSGRSD